MLCATLALLAALASTGADEEAAQAFGAGLAEVEALAGAQRWAEARERLDALLVQHEGAAHARAARRRLLSLATQLLFETSYVPPDEDALLGSDPGHRRLDRRRRRLEVSYTDRSPRATTASAAAGDDASDSTFHPRGFSWRDGLLLHDVPFSGPVRITVEGLLPPRGKLRTHPPQLVLVVDETLEYHVDFTWPTRYAATVGQWTQGSATCWRDGQAEHLGTDGTPGVKYDMMWGERYELQLVVKREVLAAALQGRSMLSVRKGDPRAGRLGLRYCPSVRRVSLSGSVGDELLGQLAAEHRAREYERFVQGVKAADVLPEWLARS